MKIKPATEVKAKLSEVLDACRTEPVLITRNGKPDALLLHVDEDTDLESLVLANSPVFQAILRKGEEQVRQGKLLAYEDLRAEFLPREKATEPGKRPARSRKMPPRKPASS